MEFLMVLSGFEFRFEKVPCDKFRLSYGIFYKQLKTELKTFHFLQHGMKRKTINMLTDTLRTLSLRKLYKLMTVMVCMLRHSAGYFISYNYSMPQTGDRYFWPLWSWRDNVAEARERLNEAKKMVTVEVACEEKARDKARSKMRDFWCWAEKWLRGYQMAESCRYAAFSISKS
jgi:hypothetical protein